MQPLFRINLSNPLKNSSVYLDILRKVDYPKLYLQFDRYKEILSSENPKPLEGRIRRILRLHNKELRTLHYCSYLHPREYSQSENAAKNWYDIEDHRRRLWTGLPLYHDHTGHLKAHVLQQHSFVRKIKRADPSFKIGEESIVRYEQFMTLIKKHGHEKKLSPPLDVDIIWHAHMLDHTSYVEATKEYFGTILDHDDSEKPEKQLQLQKNETAKLWEKHYGKGDSYSPSSCSSGLSTYFIVDSLLHHSAPSSLNSRSFDTDSDCDSGCSGCGD